MDSLTANDGNDSQNVAAKGAAVLLVIGEPFSEEHKKLVLAEVTKGLHEAISRTIFTLYRKKISEPEVEFYILSALCKNVIVGNVDASVVEELSAGLSSFTVPWYHPSLQHWCPVNVHVTLKGSAGELIVGNVGASVVEKLSAGLSSFTVPWYHPSLQHWCSVNVHVTSERKRWRTGFRCWDSDVAGININDELAQIANKADLGEEGPNVSPFGNQLKEGERIIRHTSDNVAVEILANPQKQTVTLALKNFLATPSKHKHLIYGGHTFQGSGAWILQDDTFTFENFAHAFKDQDVDNAIRQQQGCTLYIYTQAEGDWSNGHIHKADFAKLLDVKLNAGEKLDNIHGVLQFTAYVGNFVKVRQLNELLQSTDVVGNIRFSRPTLYIFPGCQGDSALFGISGFNLLVNGGYSRKACFWDFTRHLDRIDAALMTHLGTDNLYGFKSVLQRKSIENVHPEIGFMYVNTSDKIKALTEAGEESKEESLMVNLAEEGSKLIQYAKQIGQFPQSCTRNQSSQSIEPVNLYHKVGIGSLDMYILNPITDSKEMKDFYQQWNQKVAQFGTSQHTSLPNNLSVCTLLVWRPSDQNDNITRIFFPGNAPQHKVIEGLEKLKSLDILKQAKCTKATLSAKPANKRPAGLSSKPPMSSKTTRASPSTTPRSEVPKKEPVAAKAIKKDKPLGAPMATSSPKSRPMSAPKAKKEDVNKKTSKAEKAPKTEKIDKTKSSTSSSPSKSSAKSSTSSTPKEIISPAKEPEVVKPSVVEEVKAEPKPTEPLAVNGDVESSVDPPQFMAAPLEPEVKQDPFEQQPPESVPEPAFTAPASGGGAMDKDKLIELGIYDEDQDIEQDLNAQSGQMAVQEDSRVPQVFGTGMTDSMHEGLVDDMNAMNAMQGSFHGDLMSGSMHEDMFENKQSFGEQAYLAENGGTSVDDMLTPEDETSEEIQPQALPEPQAYAPSSYSQEPDVIPSLGVKDEPANLVEVEPVPVVQEPDLLPQKQEAVDEESRSQDGDEESTIPVEEKDATFEPENVEKVLDTPDEVENALPDDEGFSQLPEDIEEKDVTEETEKEIPAPVESEQVTTDKDEIEDKEEVKEVESADIDFQNKQMPAETVQEEQSMSDDEEEDMPPVEHDMEEPAGMVSQEIMKPETVKTEESLPVETGREESEAGLVNLGFDGDSVGVTNSSQPAPLIDTDERLASSPEPELEVQAGTFESQEQDIMDRPASPEPTELEQDQRDEMLNQEEMAGKSEDKEYGLEDEMVIKSDDKVEYGLEDEMVIKSGDNRLIHGFEGGDSDIIENDFVEEKELTEAGHAANENVPQMQYEERAETPDSMVERADTPDSQIGVERECRDSLEKDVSKEASPCSMEDRDSIERDVQRTSEDRDSIERDVQRTSESPAAPEEARESIEKSFEDGSEEESEEEEEEDEEEEDSSSFEQEEEATDEKCLIPGSMSEEQNVKDGKTVDTNSLVGPLDSLVEQPSDNILSPSDKILTPDLTPESETTDPMNEGQVGYRQMGDQEEVDSEEEDKMNFTPPPPHQSSPFGQDFDQFGAPPQASEQNRNPFEMDTQPGLNPFVDNVSPIAQAPGKFEDSSPEDEHGPMGGPAGFNPLAEWGEPMGLPSPPPPEENSGTTANKKSPTGKSPSKLGAAKKTDSDPKKDAKKPASTFQRKTPASAASKPAPKTSNGAPEKSKSRQSTGGPNTSLNTSRTTSKPSSAKPAVPKARPATAPAKSAADSKPKTNGTKRPATATGTAKSAPKMPPLPAFTPFYVDLTYIPNHGNPLYSDTEFFKRIRARYYVLSALSPNPQILDSLVEAKKTWEDKELPVTVIPTYDNETLRLWMNLHKDLLAEQKITVDPSASRCTIQLQDHETSSSAYRLEF